MAHGCTLCDLLMTPPNPAPSLLNSKKPDVSNFWVVEMEEGPRSTSVNRG